MIKLTSNKKKKINLNIFWKRLGMEIMSIEVKIELRKFEWMVWYNDVVLLKFNKNKERQKNTFELKSISATLKIGLGEKRNLSL